MFSLFKSKTEESKSILIATVLASGMAFLSASTITIALPAIQSHFDASIGQIQWIFNAHILVLVSIILITGSWGDSYGRKKIFTLGLLIFAVGSFLSVFSPSINHLIFYQIMTGIGGAMVIPLSLAIINSSIPLSKRGRAIGLWAGFSGGVASLGPFFGGWLVEMFGWPSVFYFNTALALIALFTALKFIPESMGERKRIDWAGAILIMFSLLGIVLGLIRGPVSGWDTLSLFSITLGIVFLFIFIMFELKFKNPLVPFEIFKNPLVAGANMVTLFLYFALNGLIFYLVLNFQQIQGYSPFWTGVGLLPPILLITILSGKAGTLADKYGPRFQMIAGPLIVALGNAFLIIPGHDANYFINFLPSLVLVGIGMALTIAPLTKSALSVKQSHSGVASGISNAVSRVATLLSIAILGAVLISIFTSSIEKNISESSLSDNERVSIYNQYDKVGGIEIPENFSQSSRQSAKNAIGNSFIDGFRAIMIINTLLAVFAALVSYFTIKEHGIKYKIRQLWLLARNKLNFI